MTFNAKNIFNRKGAEDKDRSIVETRAASANKRDAGITSVDSHGQNQFQMSGGSRKRSWFEYIRTREFWMALALG